MQRGRLIPTAIDHMHILGRSIALLSLVTLAAGLGTGPAHAQPTANPAFAPAQAPAGRSSAALLPELRRERFVYVQRQNIDGAALIDLNLFSDVELVAVLDRIQPTKNGGYIWIGHVEGYPDSLVLLSLLGDAMVGNVKLDGEFYRIRYAGDGIHVIRDLDESRFPDDHPPGSMTVQIPSAAVGRSPAPLSTDPNDELDLMVVYTAQARNRQGGIDGMEALIFLAVEETNIGFDNSSVDTSVGLVHVAEVSYTESGNLQTDRDRLKNPSDGFMDGVHTLRDEFCADQVSLIVDTGNACGITYIQDPAPDSTFEDSAFSVVRDHCATGYYSFAHEIGHIMGARHNTQADSTNTPYAYGHGHYDTSVDMRTIMSYNCPGGCTRQNQWSNPNDTMGGRPAGVTGTSENYRVLNNTDDTVANFRVRATCQANNTAENVWGKDTWDDPGTEPNPTTQPVWKSAYIWNRHAPDPNQVHQHRHQDPVMGQLNYAHVKLHNDFSSAASGNLEFYISLASTGLVWPTDWISIGTVPVSAMAAYESDIFALAWIPPTTGEICMLARYVGTNPVDAPTGETSNVNSNTKNNNNIVWRNFNVINAGGGDMVDTSFDMQNIEAVSGVDLEIDFPNGPSDNNIISDGGNVRIDLTEICAEWGLGGSLGSGFQIVSPCVVDVNSPAGASIENIQLPLGQRFGINATTTAPPVAALEGCDDEQGAAATGDTGADEPGWPGSFNQCGMYAVDFVQFDDGVEVGGVGFVLNVVSRVPVLGNWGFVALTTALLAIAGAALPRRAVPRR